MNTTTHAPLLARLLGRLIPLAAVIGCVREAAPASHREPVRVAAAADLGRAFEELGRLFEQRTGQAVVMTFGSSGLLSRQVREGAPFDMLAAANAAYVDDVIASGACDPASRALYARGRIVVWSGRADIAPPASLADLRDARFRRIAIANPAHAPYGVAAQQALEQAGVWRDVEPRLVLGDNVRQALQFAESGNADVAIVAHSLVGPSPVGPSPVGPSPVGRGAPGRWLLIDEALHRPIEQALVACTRGANRAGGEAFARFIVGDEGRAALRRFGYTIDAATTAPSGARP